MARDDAKKDIERIKEDIQVLIKDLLSLKDHSTDILSDQLENLTSTISNIKDSSKNKLKQGNVLFQALSFVYGDTIKAVTLSVGAAAFITYLFSRNR